MTICEDINQACAKELEFLNRYISKSRSTVTTQILRTKSNSNNIFSPAIRMQIHTMGLNILNYDQPKRRQHGCRMNYEKSKQLMVTVMPSSGWNSSHPS